jgi:hypothetical protein
MRYVKSSQAVAMFIYGHRLRVYSIEPTTKSGDGSKRNTPIAISWGGGKTDGFDEMTIVKLAYQFCRSLPLNDKGKKEL